MTFNCSSTAATNRLPSSNIVSVKSRLHGTTAGCISLTTLKLAAQRVGADQSHVLATDEQISAYLAQEAKKRELILAGESKNKLSVAFVPPVNAGGK